MEANWKASLACVLKSEGGNDDDPADHGGRTSRGITQREYDAWRTERREPTLDVWRAPQSDIESIYHGEYWSPWCALMPTPMDYMYFNTAVLAGPDRAARLLQQALGVAADGRIGPVTRQAFATATPREFVGRFTSASWAFYISLHQPRFIRGWLNRVNAVQLNAMDMMKGASA